MMWTARVSVLVAAAAAGCGPVETCVSFWITIDKGRACLDVADREARGGPGCGRAVLRRDE